MFNRTTGTCSLCNSTLTWHDDWTRNLAVSDIVEQAVYDNSNVVLNIGGGIVAPSALGGGTHAGGGGDTDTNRKKGKKKKKKKGKQARIQALKRDFTNAWASLTRASTTCCCHIVPTYARFSWQALVRLWGKVKAGLGVRGEIKPLTRTQIRKRQKQTRRLLEEQGKANGYSDAADDQV
eukprot:TRINITY_DN15517_c0_g1_i1.p1 TRINITY_DN15517_c0_g1~~TRINITY_DN15517_c0_g1_i1.p1  ORF type:complete len:179 (-),score=20.95 TRINITY_DN15517_c0_g1_i1:216-752(-)